MDAEFIIRVSLIGLLAGVIGTGSGGLVTYFLRKPSSSFLSGILGFSAGVMLVVVFMELLPEAIEIGGFLCGVAGLLLGIVMLLLMDLYFPHHHHYSDECHESRFLKAGVLLGIGIALHNIPEGLAIGAGYASGEALGLGLAVIITVQNIPEGVAMATALCIGGLHNGRVLLATALAGLPMGLGAMGGALLGSISPFFLSLSLGFAAGAMLYIVGDELIPDAHNLLSGHSATLGLVVGVVVGILLTAL
ncbi:MAG TPA: ZIP family metal transporter [Bacillota bacterium]|nr:ZIP family metal transporter [Bacillota bacterium]